MNRKKKINKILKDISKRKKTALPTEGRAVIMGEGFVISASKTLRCNSIWC